MPQQGVIETPSVIKSNKPHQLSVSNLWAQQWQNFEKSGAGRAGNNVATTHATSGGSRPPPLPAGRPQCGDVCGTSVPPEDKIVISDESSDDGTDDESSDKQQEGGPRCLPAPSSVSHGAPPTNLSPLADGAFAACAPRQVSTLDHTTRNSTAPATDATSPVQHKTALPEHGCQRNPRPFAVYRTRKNDPVKLLRVQERWASPSVLPDHQSISGPEPEDTGLHSQYWNPPSAASKRGEGIQHRSGSSALSRPRDHHDDRNRTEYPKQGDARMTGDRGEQGVGSSVPGSPVQGDRTSIPQSSAARSNNDRVLADVRPSVRPSTSQDLIGPRQSLGRRPRSGTDVGENQRPVEDSIREHDGGDVTESPPKRRKSSTSTPAVGKAVPKRQADPLRASSRSQPAQRPTTHHATPHRRRCGNPKPRSSGVASTTKQSQEKSRSIERIVDFQARYLVKWEDYEPKHNSWEPDKHFHRCPELLDQFHQTGLVTTNPPSPSRLKTPKRRSAGGVSTTTEAQREYFDVEEIIDCKPWYLVKYTGYKRSTWVPAEQLDRCPELLQQFHERMGSVYELITRRIAAQMEARRSAA